MSAHKDGIWRELYPFQSYVRMLDGHRYHYLDEGKGPVLLMVHGNPTWSFYWRNLVLAFRDRFRCVVVDHIGCGLSDKPQNYPYTLAQHIRNLRWLVEQLDLRDVTLLAHDWGGAIGLGTAVAMPQRFGRFILFNTAAFRDTRIPFRIRTCRVPYWGALSVRGLNGFARAALTWATEKPERMTAAVKAGLIAPYDSWANRIATHRFVQDIPLKPSHPSYGTLASIEAGLAQFKRRPVQFIWGMKDWCFTPHFLERFVDEFFPDAEVNPIDDAGHYVVEDAYEEIIPLVEDFLTRNGVLKGKASPAETWEKGKAKEPEKPAVKEPPAKPATPAPMEMVRSAASQVELPRLADSIVELPKAEPPKAAPPAAPLPPAPVPVPTPTPAPSQVPVTSEPSATSMPIRGTAMIEFPPAAAAPSTAPDPFAATDSSVEMVPRAFVPPPPAATPPASRTPTPAPTPPPVAPVRETALLPTVPPSSKVPKPEESPAGSMPIRGTAMIEFPPAATAPSIAPDPFAATESSVEMVPREFVAPPPPSTPPVSGTPAPSPVAPVRETAIPAASVPEPSEEPETSMGPIRGTAMIEFPPTAAAPAHDPFAATDSAVEMVPRSFVSPPAPPSVAPIREAAIPPASIPIPTPPIDKSVPQFVRPPEPAAEVDEYPFPRMTAPAAPVAPPLRDSEVDEYPFPKLTPVPATAPLAPVVPPVTTSPAEVVEPQATDPSIGVTRIPEGGFPSPTVTPESIAPVSTAAVEPRAHDPAIGDTRLPADDSIPLGVELSGSPASEAADQVIRESKEEALEDKSRPALPASSSNFTPDMGTQPTVLNMKAAAEEAADLKRAQIDSAGVIPRDAARVTPPGTQHGSAFGRKPAPPPEPVPDFVVNVALRLRRMAAIMPEALAVIAPAARDENGKRVYDRITFSQLDRVSDRLARGLKGMGVEPGTRLALMVPPGIQFVALVFGLFKAGVVTILIDPGMGRKNLLKCLSQAKPQGFVGIPLVHKIRRLLFWRFRNAKYNVVVGGHQSVAGAITFDQLRGGTWNGHVLAHTKEDDPAAIIFTTGSTGPPKGVLYRHGNFDAQVEALQEFYRIKLGEVSLSGFPLFTLFDAAMGVTSVIPDMDPTRPANVDPRNILEAVKDLHVTQAFASPAMWNRVGTYCESENLTMPTLKRVLSAGAAVPEHVLKRMQRAISPDGDVHTPYGATEALPVASIGARELLPNLAAKSRQGAGTCVGKRFGGIEWRVIRIDDAPIPTVEDAQELPAGEIGELIVSGPVVTREYFEREEATRWAKLTGGGITVSGYLSGPTVWHRMGDIGYLDEAGRFWYCGRLAHRVRTIDGTLYTEPCEAIFNTHPLVYRSALVGVGRPGKQTPVIVLEPHAGRMPTGDAKVKFLAEIRALARSNPKTERIERFLLHPSLPVDIRHNSKIFREKLARWARWRVW